MPLFDELLVKVAQNQTLTPLELENFQQEARSLSEAKTLVKSFMGGDNKILGSFLSLPIEIIYSSVLEQNLASLTIEIPSVYRHLILFGSGRTNGSGTGSDFLLAQYSGDTGNNYINQKFYAINTTVTAERDTSQPTSIIGLLGQGGRAAGEAASFISFFPHCNSNTLTKNTFSLLTPPFGSAYLIGSNWSSTNPIASLKITSGADSIASGSNISVFGWK